MKTATPHIGVNTASTTGLVVNTAVNSRPIRQSCALRPFALFVAFVLLSITAASQDVVVANAFVSMTTVKFDVTVPVSILNPGRTNTADASAGVEIAGFITAKFQGAATPAGPVCNGTLSPKGILTLPVACFPAFVPPQPTGKLQFITYGFKGPVVLYPMAGYYGLRKAATVNAKSIVFNTIGNVTAKGTADWLFTPGFFVDDWDGTMTAFFGAVDPTLPGPVAPTSAVGDLNDPVFFLLDTPGEVLSFQVSLGDVEVSVGGGANAYYVWTVMLGAGDIPGEMILFSQSGGQNFSAGNYQVNPGTLVNYSNDSLPVGPYWMTTELTIGGQFPGPIALSPILSLNREGSRAPSSPTVVAQHGGAR